jgi:hypothetical protein
MFIIKLNLVNIKSLSSVKFDISNLILFYFKNILGDLNKLEIMQYSLTFPFSSLSFPLLFLSPSPCSYKLENISEFLPWFSWLSGYHINSSGWCILQYGPISIMYFRNSLRVLCLLFVQVLLNFYFPVANSVDLLEESKS